MEWFILAPLLLLLVGSLAYTLALIVRLRRKNRELSKEVEDIAHEEHDVFDFFQDVGQAFTDGVRPSELHKRIVEGTSRVLRAEGGLLYLEDHSGTRLIPAYISRGCPPLIQIPDHIKLQAEVTPLALESFLRLHAIEPGDGLLGQVWQNKQTLHISDLVGHPMESLLLGNERPVRSLMVLPLLYFGKMCGVLAVVNGPTGGLFTEEDLHLFKSLAEHSAFSLFNANIFAQADEKRKLERDLEIARDIQRILLPEGSIHIPGYEIVGLNLPAKIVSGDYYDYVRVDEHHWGLVIADVSGKGFPASLIMTMARSILRSHSSGTTSPSTVLGKVNRQIFPDIREDMFISMAYLIFTGSDGQVSLSRAGHDAPLLYHAATGAVDRLNTPGMAVGIDTGEVFNRITKDFAINMEKDDCIVLYTDGVTEGLNDIGNVFGVERMIQILQAAAPLGAKAIVDALTRDIRQFMGDCPQNDDITLIAIRKL